MTKVIFRKFKKGGDIIALFPNLHRDKFGGNCLSYMHIGQHSDAFYNGVIRDTKPATEEEYKDLYDELERIGYDDLKVCKKRVH